MNNQQFRRLVLDKSAAAAGGETQPGTRDAGSTGMLGSRQRSNIPMTPRTVGGRSDAHREFVRQAKQEQGEPAAKRFKSSAAPKGSKLAAGYQDRSKSLRERQDDEMGDKERRVKALEEQYKLGQIERELFEKLRDEIIGDDVQSVHLVKGLDWKLLARVRRGEDVLAEKKDEATAEGSEPNEEDVDRELDELEEQEVQPLPKAEKVRTADPKAGKKRTRDDILREMKAARAKATESLPAQQALGSRFKKVGAPQPNTSRIEKDEKGRDVLITVDAEGNTKRKVRKSKPEGTASNGLLMPDKDAQPLGMAVPAPRPEEKEEIGDIFADVGSDYNPLGDMEDASDSASDSEASEAEKAKSKAPEPDDRKRVRFRSASRSRSPSRSASPLSSRSASSSSGGSSHRSARSPSPRASAATATTSAKPASVPRNYFATQDSSASANDTRPANPLQDPTMLAALKRAAAIAAPSESEAASQRSEAAEKAERHRRMLASAQEDRDLDDMDLGFGESRRGDEEDDGGRVKLSEWGDDEDKGDHQGRGGQKQRKRGKKKKKGDKDSVRDVLGAMDRRKA